MWTGWNGLLHECCNSLTQQLLVEVNLSKTYWYSDFFFNIWDNVRHINWILFSFIPINTSVSFKWNCFNELAYIYFKELPEWGFLPQCAIQLFWIIKNLWSVFKCLRGKKQNIWNSGKENIVSRAGPILYIFMCVSIYLSIDRSSDLEIDLYIDILRVSTTFVYVTSCGFLVFFSLNN